MTQGSRLSVYSASVAGTSHLRRGTERQDQVFHRSEKGFTIAVVSDGAGSAPNSALGALVTTRTVTTTATWHLLQLTESPDAGALEEVLNCAALAARRSLELMAWQTGEPLGSYANTLLLAIQTETLLGAAQVGDGGIVVSDSQDGFQLFTSPQRGEYANQTTFITSRNGLETMEVRVAEAQPRYLAMFSDGLQNLVIESATQQPFRPFFSNVFQWLEKQSDPRRVESELASLLRSPRVTAKSDDDITLLLATRR